MTTLTIYADTTTVVQLSDVKNRGVAVTDATVSCLGVSGLDGVALSPDSFPISMPYSESLGLYEGLIPPDIGIVAGKSYFVEVKATDGSIIRTWSCRAEAQRC